MKTLPLINVDAGEGEPRSALDIALLDHVDALNLALGGHAGDPGWTRELAEMAEGRGLRVHLHPGYPDRENFGRVRLQISREELLVSLSQQRRVLPEITTCKFHGALYNGAAHDSELAATLAAWCLEEGITEVLAPPHSALAHAAAERDIAVLREGFADRAYVLSDGQLRLASRVEEGATLDSVEEAVAQVEHIVEKGEVALRGGGSAPLPCDTICLHGDGPIALELASALRRWKGGRDHA